MGGPKAKGSSMLANSSIVELTPLIAAATQLKAIPQNHHHHHHRDPTGGIDTKSFIKNSTTANDEKAVDDFFGSTSLTTTKPQEKDHDDVETPRKDFLKNLEEIDKKKRQEEDDVKMSI